LPRPGTGVKQQLPPLFWPNKKQRIELAKVPWKPAKATVSP
jgi:hypothetical protein